MNGVEFTTVEDVRKGAEIDYERDHPRPVPPEPVSVGYPVVVSVGNNAHLWIDVSGEYSSFDRNSSINGKMFVVERQHTQDQRIEGSLSPENIDALIRELQRVRADVMAKQAFITANAVYEKQTQEWDRSKNEFARRQVAAWEKAQKKKE